MKNTFRQENLIYAVLWGVLFATPVLSLYIRTVATPSSSLDWTEVMVVWRGFAAYLLMFLIHNFLLAPLLINKHRYWTYLAAMAVVLTMFVTYQCSHHPHDIGEKHHHMREIPVEKHRMGEPDMMPLHAPQPPQGQPPRRHHPPMLMGEREVVAVAVLLLMFAANLGCKFFFRNKQEHGRLAELEKKNLEQQLEYLRYQINPHFFMNTLNNIHALVDIDPEKAKDIIVELSKMMRFVLYEGNKQWVSLSRETDFIRHYVSLMRLRYTDQVKIMVNLPAESPDRLLPPLMLITFIENAFKHGISYQKASYVDVNVVVADDRLLFKCDNSKTDGAAGEKGGVGLRNVKQRLRLLYDDDFVLSIQDNACNYLVELDIPLLDYDTLHSNR